MGDGYALNDDNPAADWKDLETYQYVTKFAFQDFDPGPTKAFIVTNRNHPDYSKYFDIGFGKRPEEELYDKRNDPEQLNNVADDKKYAKVKAKLAAQLLEVMEDTQDPRLNDTFDFLPYVE